MQSAKPLSVLLSLVFAGTLQGCNTLSGVGGSSEFSCKAQPGVHCESVSGNYQNAMQNNLPGQRPAMNPPMSQSSPERGGVRAATRSQPVALISTQGEQRSLWQATTNAAALRAPVRILRLWFKPWEDADNDLFDQGYIYVQVDGGRWMVEHAQRKIRGGYAPIRPPHTAQSPGAAPTARAAAASDAPGAAASLPGREEALERLSALKAPGKQEAGAVEE